MVQQGIYFLLCDNGKQQLNNNYPRLDQPILRKKKILMGKFYHKIKNKGIEKEKKNIRNQIPRIVGPPFSVCGKPFKMVRLLCQ